MSIKVEDPIRRPTRSAKIVTYRANSAPSTRIDSLITEEPLEIRVHGPGQDPVQVATIMRSPGNDFELAVGFLVSEGVISSRSDLATVCYCNLEGREEQRYNVVTVALTSPYLSRRSRNMTVSSSCGVCGTSAIDQIELEIAPIQTQFKIPARLILELPQRLRKRQKLFDATGGVHGAGIFGLDETVPLVREDVGRHNAMDKVIGKALMDGVLPLSCSIGVLSGRIAFELVQKAGFAGIAVLVSVGAPTSLAVSLAQRLNITLCGFVDLDHFNVYTHTDRVVFD